MIQVSLTKEISYKDGFLFYPKDKLQVKGSWTREVPLPARLNDESIFIARSDNSDVCIISSVYLINRLSMFINKDEYEFLVVPKEYVVAPLQLWKIQNPVELYGVAIENAQPELPVEVSFIINSKEQISDILSAVEVTENRCKCIMLDYKGHIIHLYIFPCKVSKLNPKWNIDFTNRIAKLIGVE